MTPAATLGHPAAPLPVLPLGVPGADALGFDHVPHPARKRRPFRKPDMTGFVFERPHEADEHAVKVSLFGKYGYGQWMNLYREDWASVSSAFTRRWVVLGGSHRTRYYIRSGVRAVARAAR